MNIESGIFNKMPKYSVNDIVIIDKGFSFECGHNVVGVIKDVFNHGITGEVFYHIIFNSGGLRKVFEDEIEAKFNKDRFKDGQSIHKQLLAKMYHTRNHKYLSESEVIAWAYDANLIDVDDAIKANYTIEEIKKMINNTFGVPEFAKIKKFTEMFEGEIKGLVSYKKIIFNGPCTIILWKDGTKTIAKATGSDMFDPEKGVAICFMKKILGHTETNKILRKVNKQYEDYIVENGIQTTLLDSIAASLHFVNPIAHVSDINPNSVICIDQSTIEEVKKVEEEDK